MTPRDFGPPTEAPREHLARLAAQVAAPAGADDAAAVPTGVAFLFGCERFGMKNDDVYRRHVALRSRPRPTTVRSTWPPQCS